MAHWQPSADRDQAIRTWLESEGINVTSTYYYFNEEAYAWRDDTPRPTLTLTVSRWALEDYTADQLVAALKALRAADGMRHDPRGRIAMMVKDGALSLCVWP